LAEGSPGAIVGPQEAVSGHHPRFSRAIGYWVGVLPDQGGDTQGFVARRRSEAAHLFENAAQLFDFSARLFENAAHLFDFSARHFENAAQLFDFAAHLFENAARLFDSAARLFAEADEHFGAAGHVLRSAVPRAGVAGRLLGPGGHPPSQGGPSADFGPRTLSRCGVFTFAGECRPAPARRVPSPTRRLPTPAAGSSPRAPDS
jgi:hypothetical protein